MNNGKRLGVSYSGNQEKMDAGFRKTSPLQHGGSFIAFVRCIR